MSILIQVLSKPSLLAKLDKDQWQTLLAQANSSQLISRLNYLMDCHQYEKPTYIKWHLESAYKIAEKQRKQAIVEFLEVPRSLKTVATQLVFLKGAAYIAKNLPCSFGRTFSDIDVLVKKDEIKKIETVLKFSGWLKTEIDDYDDEYYRRWMHEIPPLRHVSRGTVLDVHHNILPTTNKNMPNIEQFEFETIAVEHVGQITTLSDFDLCIHSAVHLFTESEFHHGLRDISDFDLTVRHFTQHNTNFSTQLLDRAAALGLHSYVRLALKFCYQLFNTPLSEQLKKQLNHHNKTLNLLENFCFMAVFQPNHKTARTWRFSIATHLLYWRGHLLRMPLHLLIPHLIKKSIKRGKDLFNKNDDVSNLP